MQHPNIGSAEYIVIQCTRYIEKRDLRSLSQPTFNIIINNLHLQPTTPLQQIPPRCHPPAYPHKPIQLLHKKIDKPPTHLTRKSKKYINPIKTQPASTILSEFVERAEGEFEE